MGRATKTAAKLRKEKIDGLIYFFCSCCSRVITSQTSQKHHKKIIRGNEKIQLGCAANGPRRRTKPAILRLLDISPFLFFFVVPFEAQTTKVIIVAAESEILFFQCVRRDRPQSRFFSSGVNWHVLASITTPPPPHFSPPPLPPPQPLPLLTGGRRECDESFNDLWLRERSARTACHASAQPSS